MKQFFVEQGELLVQTLICMSIVSLLFAGWTNQNVERNILVKISRGVEMESVLSLRTDLAELAEIEKTPLPVIERRGTGNLYAGHQYQMEECFVAIDQSDQRQLSCRVKKVICSMNGSDLTTEVCGEDNKICFQNPGEYAIVLETMDSHNKETCRILRFAVNRRQEH